MTITKYFSATVFMLLIVFGVYKQFTEGRWKSTAPSAQSDPLHPSLPARRKLIVGGVISFTGTEVVSDEDVIGATVYIGIDAAGRGPYFRNVRFAMFSSKTAFSKQVP